MPIRKRGEKVKGTTRVSFGDRKLMTRLWIADKTSRYEKRRATRAMNIKEKEFFAQCPSVRAETAYKAFKKDMKAVPKRFQLPEDEEDEDIAAIDTASRFCWFRLVRRHNALQDDNKMLDAFLRDNLRGASGKTKLADPGTFALQLLSEMGAGDKTDIGCDDFAAFSSSSSSAADVGSKKKTKATLPKSSAASLKLVESLVQKTRSDSDLFPLLFARRNMRLVYQYRRLTKRTEQFADTVTSSSSHGFMQHMFHGAYDGAAATENERFAFEKGRNEKKTAQQRRHSDMANSDFVNFDHEYSFASGGLHAVDGAWSLIDGNAAPPRLLIQPRQWHVAGDSVINSLASKTTAVLSASPSAQAVQRHLLCAADGQDALTPLSTFTSEVAGAFLSAQPRQSGGSGGSGASAVEERESRSSGDIGGFGFANEEKQRLHLKTEQRVNNVVFRHAYEVERQASMWTTCQRCRTPVHTCDMVLRESLGVEDVACFHPQCLQAVSDARSEQMEAAEAREQLVAHFTPLVVADKQRVRDSVYNEIAAPIIATRERRERWMAENGAAISAASSQSSRKRKRSNIDTILAQMISRPERKSHK